MLCEWTRCCGMQCHSTSYLSVAIYGCHPRTEQTDYYWCVSCACIKTKVCNIWCLLCVCKNKNAYKNKISINWLVEATWTCLFVANIQSVSGWWHQSWWMESMYRISMSICKDSNVGEKYGGHFNSRFWICYVSYGWFVVIT